MKTKYRQNHFLQVFSNCITCQLRDFQILWKTTALFLISFRIRVKTASPNKELTSCEWIGESEIHELQRYFWHALRHNMSHVNQSMNRAQPLTVIAHLKVKYLNSFKTLY